MTRLATLMLLAGATLLPAQVGSVEGVVRTSQGDKPLPYARVQVLGDSLADWTDDEGVYRISGLARGEWRLRVIHPGHDSLDVTVFVPGNRDVRLDVTLEKHLGPAVDALADFQPFQVEYTLPALLNGAAVAALMQRLYPPDLARHHIGGEAVLWLWLDEQGKVVRSRISSSSGYPALDSIALTLSDSMRFRPARNRQSAARVIVRMPITFTVQDSVRGEQPE